MELDVRRKVEGGLVFAGGLLLAAWLNTLAKNDDPGAEATNRAAQPPARTASRWVENDQYSDGMRILTFKPRVPSEVMTLVIELCDNGNLLKQTKYIQRDDARDRYFSSGRSSVVRDALACSDDRITRADQDRLGIPVPPPAPPLPRPEVPKYDTQAIPVNLS